MTASTEFFQPPVFENIYRVYFELETGTIVSITNEILDRDDLSSIEVSFEEIESLVNGEESFFDRTVEFDTRLKAYVLKQNTIETDVYTVDDAVYKITSAEDADIQIIQDLKNTCWKFLISESLRNEMIEKKVKLKTMLSFSVTEENNPNLLYRTIQVPFEQLVKEYYVVKDFLHEYEHHGKPVSVYTIKRFESYSYEVVR